MAEAWRGGGRGGNMVGPDSGNSGEMGWRWLFSGWVALLLTLLEKGSRSPFWWMIAGRPAWMRMETTIGSEIRISSLTGPGRQQGVVINSCHRKITG